jgi:hypothetical protein
MNQTLAAVPASFTPAATIDDVVTRLDAIITRARAKSDRAGFFACLYRDVTVHVRDGIAAGRFQDGARMARLDVVFANRYLAAEAAVRAGRRPSHSWAVAFDAARRRDLIILQHLLLGMNAHINLDLGVASAQVAPGAELTGLKHDFIEITVLLNELLDDVQNRIARVSPWMGVLDRVGGRGEEEVCKFCLGGSRDVAWRTAEHLARLEPARHDAEIDRLDRIVAMLALPIRSPGLLLRAALAGIRLREPNAVAPVLDALS